MDNHFNSNGGDQNIAQGDHAIGKQQNNPSSTGNQSPAIVAGGNVSVSYGVPLKSKTVVIGSVLVAAVLGASFVGDHLLAPAGKSTTTTGNNAPAIIAEKGNVSVTYNISGVSEDDSDTAKSCKDVGGINFNEYCGRKYGGHAQSEDGNAFGWRCIANKKLYEISVNEACEIQYGRKTQADANNPKNPFSWRCIQCR